MKYCFNGRHQSQYDFIREDRITPAKKVAMALTEFIKTRYPKDSIEIIVFGNDAWPH